MSRPEHDPLVERLDALMRRGAGRESDVPVLTEAIDEERAPRRTLDPGALEALARELERAVLDRIGPEVERLVAQAHERLQGQLQVSVAQVVREAIAASIARALTVPRQD